MRHQAKGHPPARILSPFAQLLRIGSKRMLLLPPSFSPHKWRYRGAVPETKAGIARICQALSPSFLHLHAHQIHLKDAHKLGHKRLQVEYHLGPRLDSMLVKCRPTDHVALESVVNQGQQFKCESLQNRCRRDAVRQEVVELRPHLQDSGRRMFIDNFSGYLAYECLPVRWRNWRVLCDLFTVKQRVSTYAYPSLLYSPPRDWKAPFHLGGCLTSGRGQPHT